MSTNTKLFNWQNINTFVRGIIEPHVQALRKRHDAYVVFNDRRHEAFKQDINTRFNEFREWTIKELTELRSWTQTEIKYLKDTLIDEETGMLKYEVIPVEQLIDVGTIVVWPVAKNSVAMDKYLECNGQRIPDGKEYYDLKSILQSDTVPDYRGVFLRGYGSCTSTHYNTVTHTSGALGILQGDCSRHLYGKNAALWEAETGYGINATGIFQFVPSTDGLNSQASNEAAGARGMGSHVYGIRWWVFDNSKETPVDNEYRPINKAVRYLIRAIASTN